LNNDCEKKNSDFRFSFFFFISIDIHALKFVLNFQALIREISVFITQKVQKNVNFSKFSKFYNSSKNDSQTSKIVQNMYYTKVLNVCKFQVFWVIIEIVMTKKFLIR